MEAALLSLGRHAARKLARDLGEKAAAALPRARGEWRGHLIAEAEGKGWRVRTDPADPCRLFVAETGLEYRWDGEFWSDGGSIPKAFQGAKHLRLRPDSFPRSYFLHDDVYANWRVFVREDGTKEWRRVPVTRLEADTLLYVGLVAECATALEARVIFRAVRMFGHHAWNAHRRDADKLKSSEVEKLKSNLSTSQPFNPSTGEAKPSTGEAHLSTSQPFNSSTVPRLRRKRK
jgi:hypothetical protein